MIPGFVSPCPVCEAAAWRQDPVAGRVIGLREPYRILVCTRCGQRRLDPPLLAEELSEVYSGAYFSSDEKEVGVLPAFSERTGDEAAVFSGRATKFAGTIVDFKRHRPAARSILDVGAATGVFVKVARESGFLADGIEFSSFAVQQAKEAYGIELTQATLSGFRSDKSYDIVHLNHVLEHFSDPASELGHIRRLLTDGGMLYVEIPYQFHVVEKLSFLLRRRQASFGLHSLHHPYFYTPATIVKLLRSQGFRVISLSVFSAARYDASTLLGKCKRVAWWALSKVRIGNHIEVFAERSF